MNSRGHDPSKYYRPPLPPPPPVIPCVIVLGERKADNIYHGQNVFRNINAVYYTLRRTIRPNKAEHLDTLKPPFRIKVNSFLQIRATRRFELALA